MYGSKKKPVKKYLGGGPLAAGSAAATGGLSLAIPAIAQGVMGLGQSIFGMSQARKAREAIKEIQKNAPNIRIPTAIRQLADEPIAEEYMEAQELGAQRRTATAIDALGRGGSRSLGILPSVMEQERVGEQQRAGQYEQMRKSALSALGQAQDTKLAREMDQYAREIDAARQSQMAGQQNIFGGLGQIGRGIAAFDFSGGDSSFLDEAGESAASAIEDFRKATRTPTRKRTGIGQSLYSDFRKEKGGMLPKYKMGGDMPMKTEGEFNHNTNPKALIDEKTGEKQAELTGDEVILNKDQYKKMQKLAEEGKAEELLAYYKKLSAKFEKEKA